MMMTDHYQYIQRVGIYTRRDRTGRQSYFRRSQHEYLLAETCTPAGDGAMYDDDDDDGGCMGADVNDDESVTHGRGNDCCSTAGFIEGDHDDHTKWSITRASRSEYNVNGAECDDWNIESDAFLGLLRSGVRLSNAAAVQPTEIRISDAVCTARSERLPGWCAVR